MSDKRCRDRFGYSLVEMVVMLSVLTMVMTVALGWVHASMKFSSAVKNRAIVHQQLNRLEDDLRTRIASCDAMRVDDNTLELNSGEAQTRYTIKDGILERVHILNSGEAAGSTSVESFRIGRDVDAIWGTDELPNRVSLTIRQRPVTVGSGESASSIGSLETPKLEWHLRAGPREVGK